MVSKPSLVDSFSGHELIGNAFYLQQPFRAAVFLSAPCWGVGFAIP